MKIEDLINNQTLVDLLARVEEDCKDKVFSDIIDEQGNQYVDLVMEGGGMLGIALVGYTYVLEQAGIRFLGVGGTSAGSINALLLAALDEPGKPKGEKLLAELASTNLQDFVDGDADARNFIESWLGGAGKLMLAFRAAQVIDNLQNDLGLNPGTAFTAWLEQRLAREGIYDYAGLTTRMRRVPDGIRLRSGAPFDKPVEDLFRLAIIATDVTTETKVEFPRMASLYWDDVDSIHPAQFVRASMSIPYFFHPMKVDNIPNDEAAEQRWQAWAGYRAFDEGSLPSEVMFIDGGVMSNFPIDVFHDSNKVPNNPTFGVKLGLDRRLKDINGPLNMLVAIFNTARNTRDYEFIHKNIDYSKLVTWIPTEGFNGLDFSMSDEDKISLFLEGARCAADFLCDFDWHGYKALRASAAPQAAEATTAGV